MPVGAILSMCARDESGRGGFGIFITVIEILREFRAKIKKIPSFRVKNMKLEQLQHVVEVAKHKSISKAANALFLSQSTLSLSIKALENELGDALFYRTPKGAFVTPFGKEFVSYVETILLQVDQLSHIKAPQFRSGFHISVANMGFRFVSDACAKLYHQYCDSGIVIDLWDKVETGNTIDPIADRTCEIGVTRIWSCFKKTLRAQMRMKEVQFFPLTQARVSVIIGHGNPLFDADIEEISAEQLEPFPLIAYPPDQEGVYSSIIDRLNLPVAKNRILVLSRAANYELLDHTPAYYITATPRRAYEHTDYYPSARSIPLADCKITAEIGWIKHADYHLTPLASEFVNILSGYFD